MSPHIMSEWVSLMVSRRDRSIGGAVKIVGRPSVRINKQTAAYDAHYKMLPFIEGQRYAGDIAKDAGYQNPTGTRYLTHLYEEGLVDRKRIGRKYLYWRIDGSALPAQTETKGS